MIPIFVVASAPFFGSFMANYAVRWPAGQQVVTGRSRCSSCGNPLSVTDLLPMVSWFWLCGRCRACSDKISFFYPAVECAALGIAIWTILTVQSEMIVPTFGFGCILLTLGIIDGQTYLLPDLLTLGLIPLGLIECLAVEPAAILDHLIGAAAGFTAFAATIAMYSLVRGRPGLGLGDAKLLAGLGAWTSWQLLPELIMLAAFGGLAFVTVRSVARRVPLSSTDRIAFGPFLCVSGWLVFLYGSTDNI